MHEAKPYGHLTLNGTAIDDDTLARMTGIPVAEVRALMAELRKAGVLSVTGKGVVFSRRMTRDFALAQKGRKSANKRWSQTTDLEQESDEPNGLPNGVPTQNPHAKTIRVIDNPLKPPRGGRKRDRGATVFFRKANDDGIERPEEGVGSGGADARGLPLLASGNH